MPTATDRGSNGGTGGAAGPAADGLLGNRSAALLQAGSYTSTWSMRVTEGETTVSETVFTTRVNVDSERYHVTMQSTSDGELETGMEIYHKDGNDYQRIGEGTEASTTVMEGAFMSMPPYGRGAFVDASGLDGFRRAGTETYDGVQVQRYVMAESPSWIAGQGRGNVQWTDFNYEVLVDDQGLVRSESWRGEGVDDSGTPHSVAFSFTLTGVGSTTVDEPSWVAQA